MQGQVTISGSQITDNVASDSGGGIYVLSGTVSIMVSLHSACSMDTWRSRLPCLMPYAVRTSPSETHLAMSGDPCVFPLHHASDLQIVAWCCATQDCRAVCCLTRMRPGS